MAKRARCATVLLLAATLVGGSAGNVTAATAPTTTFADAGARALTTLLGVYYTGNGLWNECDPPGCGQANSDWGVDALTYTLWLRWQTNADASIPPVLAALLGTSPTYPAACDLPDCQSWSDVPEWDAIAALREYAVDHDPQALAKARAAFSFVEDGSAFALGACPDVRYQQPSGHDNHLKTLETDGNAIKAAILLYQATGERPFLDDAVARYAAVRAHFLDPAVALYSVYVFDDGQTCTQVPHRFFASVNGDMIWSGVELSQITGMQAYLTEALATAKAVAGGLADPAGVYADLQAENDIAEPLVEAMYSLATEANAAFARTWLLKNAAAAISDRTADGSFGRFFDGPAPTTTVTAWQSSGGLALEIAAAALDPTGVVPLASLWTGLHRVNRSIGPTGSVTFTGKAIAFYGTLGETCCEAGHARVLVDGRETVDGTGIWQNKSSSGLSIPGTVLFAWRWSRPGRHTIRFAPGIANGKEGGSFLHVQGYLSG